jgi:hypothetical protein
VQAHAGVEIQLIDKLGDQRFEGVLVIRSEHADDGCRGEIFSTRRRFDVEAVRQCCAHDCE